jgi:hypothetical protein
VGCVIPCGVWSYSIADAECLLHGVGLGSGFRIVLVFCSHRAIVEGADRNGKRVRFDLKQQDCIFRPPQLFGGRGISPADCIFTALSVTLVPCAVCSLPTYIRLSIYNMRTCVGRMLAVLFAAYSWTAAGRQSLSPASRVQVDSVSATSRCARVVAAEATPLLYAGPEAETLRNVQASIELEESGLVLEVADSLVANGGLGLFVRVLDGAGSVTLDGGSPLCGYAEGEMADTPDAAGGKTVAFQLRSCDAAVFFEGRLRTVRDLLLSEEGVESVAGHALLRDAASGSVDRLELQGEPRYFVPAAEQPSPPTIMTLGQRANDLALAEASGAEGVEEYVPADEAMYRGCSAVANALVLVQRLERSPETPSELRPTRPITTLARTVTFANALPMEVGCQYGGQYWGLQTGEEA